MKAWVRKSIYSLMVTIGLILLVLGGGWWAVRSTPDWYEQSLESSHLSPNTLQVMDLEDQLANLRNWAIDTVKVAGQATDASQPVAPEEFTLTLQESQVNSCISKWAEEFGFEEQYSRYLTDPRIRIRDGKLLIAARVTELDTILSVSVHVDVRQQQLDTGIDSVMGGSLPIPRTIWQKQINKLRSYTVSQLPTLKVNSRYNDSGTVNLSTMLVGAADLLINTADSKPSTTIFYIPLMDTPYGIPIEIRRVGIEEGLLHITLGTLSAAQKDQLRQQIKAYGNRRTPIAAR